MAMPTDSALPMALPVHEEERVQEASLHASLGRLQEMHVAVSSSSIVSQSLKGQFVNSTASKLRRLRDTIPHVVTSIQLATSTLEPAEFYAQFAYAATAAGKDIKEFMHMMSDNRAKEIFEQINKSREADGEGIDGWRVTEHEDWLDIKKVPKDEVDSDEDMEGQGNPIKVEGREKVVAAFRAAHPDIEVLLRDLVTIKLPPPVNINFFAACTDKASRDKELGIATTDSEPEATWKVSRITNSTMRETTFTKSILDTMTASEHQLKDLESLLGLVASYSDVTTQPCAKCSRTVDRIGQFPIVRKKNRSQQAAERKLTQWLAFHKACT